MSDNYKRLLPAPLPPGSAQPNVSEASSQKEVGPPVKKRTVSKAACNNCRLKKIRCDSKRPCTACSKAGVECNFVTASSDETPFMALKREVESLRRSTGDMTEIFDLLETAPDAVSLDILRRLKSTRHHPEGVSNASDVLASVKKDLEEEPALPVKLSNRQLMAGLIPETQQTPEYELMMRCPTTYTMLIPVEVAFINLANLLRPAVLEDPRPSSVAGLGDIPSSLSVPSASNGITLWDRTAFNPPEAGNQGIGNSEPLQSIHALVDARLEVVNFLKWTSVPIPNELAATLISLYLEIDYPWRPLFDADLFLNDCVEGKTHFCSALLVNALLGWACLFYSNLKPEASGFVIAFETEAERLWQIDKLSNTLTAVAASQLLSDISACKGRDDFANRCLEEGIQMGIRMGLFEVTANNAPDPGWLHHHQYWFRAACHTSWGIFTCACIRSLHLHRAELNIPPLLPVPGDYYEEHNHPGFTPPNSKSFAPTRVGETFKALCKLSLIVHEIILVYFGRSDTAPAARATIEFAEQIYQKLFDWAASLPLELARGRRNRHSTLMLHLYYHCIVMVLFWPFLQHHGDEKIKVNQLTTTTATTQEIHKASVNQLKRLGLIHCIDFNIACSSTLWHIGLIYLANAMLCETMRSGNLRDPERWFYFMLCMTFYENLYGSFQVVEVTVLGLLSMALRNGFLSAPEANTILKNMRRIGQRYDSHFTVRASFMVDLELAMTNPKEAMVQTLANDFHELAIFQEFTTGELR
ncbi:uncharacterized protein F4807DRAFT_415789 [Annulohypoxylon truncatum]|uniref:uncharacterized protein n=1 Tax=Annulohypoxylon truncatum TaxID=327061 RepID=UPI002007A51C|nr:uncharacterized protein F4807DRAFT_415789 [Annulohypoxylon truncatum]KAI1212377.1 hypothetical protein F4807DRAFT_415789 [Annulohypoxylon truncatum]